MHVQQWAPTFSYQLSYFHVVQTQLLRAET